MSDEFTRNTFDRLVDDTDGYLVGLVAQGEQGLVGLAHLVFHASTWSSASYCYLEDLLYLPPLEERPSRRRFSRPPTKRPIGAVPHAPIGKLSSTTVQPGRSMTKSAA